MFYCFILLMLCVFMQLLLAPYHPKLHPSANLNPKDSAVTLLRTNDNGTAFLMDVNNSSSKSNNHNKATTAHINSDVRIMMCNIISHLYVTLH